MADSYIPPEDAAALVWMQNFGAILTATPALYALTSADAAAVTSAVNAFDAAYTISQNPSTRTEVTVAAKNDARAAAEAICRQYAITIKYNAGITDPDKIAIGVRPVNNERNPINVPDSSPLLNVLGATPGSQTVRYSDTNTPDSAAKPFGATALQVFLAVTTAAVDDPSEAEFYGAFTKNPIGVGFDEADDGKVATYFARWQNRRGDVGPWSLPVSMRIAA
jgi:hypothetical protein